MHKNSAFTITALAGALLLSSCAQGGASNPEYKAKIDYANNLITLPMDEYDYDDASRVVINEASARIMQICYVSKGYSDAVPVFYDDPHNNIMVPGMLNMPRSMDMPMKKRLERPSRR